MPLIKMNSIEAAAQTIARSFMDDPFFIYLLPQPGPRMIWLKRFAAATIKMVSGLDECYVTDEQSSGAMILVPPGHYPLPAAKVAPFAARMVSMTFGCRVATGKMAGAMKVLARMEKHHPKYANWYLMQLGVDPESQGRGLGRLMMNELVARAERERIPVYLETTNEKNLAFYRHFGFELIDEIKYDNVPPVWCMVNNHNGRG